MNDIHRRRFERLVRIADFGEAHADSFDAGSKGGTALANIRTTLTEVGKLDATRNTGDSKAKQGTSIKREARASLRSQLANISRTAKTISLDMPEVKDKFRTPNGNVNDQTLLGIARSFVVEATPLRDKFIEYDMPEDFLDTLNKSLTDFEKAINQQNTGVGTRTSAISAIEVALERGEAEAKRLDTIVRNKFRVDPSTLAAWESAQHLEHAGKGKPAASKPPEAPTP
jgi:hypothetical protein